VPTGVYKRTKPIWNKGKKCPQNSYPPWHKGLTKETDVRVARMAEASAKARTGTPCSEEKKQVLRERNKGQKAWNKGLTKETDARVLKNGRSVSLSWVGLTPEEREIRIAPYRDMWKDPTVKNNWIRKLRRAANLRPNKLETLLGEILDKEFSGEWLYTGNGLVTIGGMIPDFTNINGHKTVIETFGNYWHKDKNPQDRIDKYSVFGYSCIVIWEHELKDNPEFVVERIINFMEVLNDKEKSKDSLLKME